ncbi:MAG: ABC transporter ATP-binding protein [Anaerolineales bacterium]
MEPEKQIAMIAMQGVEFSYPGGEPVFEGFTWHVDAGEPWAVLGPSGCGKSTLLYLLAGLRRPAAGRILIDGLPLERPRPRTGLILQDYGLLPWATVAENAALGLRLRRFYGPDGLHAPSDERVPDIAARVDPWLERMGLSGVRNSYPSQISGGQRQRTAIARTLALEPDLLLMDEPFASLDVPTRESLQDLVLGLQAERALTVVLVTHAVEEAALIGRRVLVLRQPPIREAWIYDNPGGGQAGFRSTPEYLETITALRRALENRE